MFPFLRGNDTSTKMWSFSQRRRHLAQIAGAFMSVVLLGHCQEALFCTACFCGYDWLLDRYDTHFPFNET